MTKNFTEQLAEWTKRVPPYVFAILHGQVISILIAGTGVFASILSNFHPNANFPLFMNLFNYFFLSLFLVKYHCCKRPTELELDDILDFDTPNEPIKKSNVEIKNWVYLGAAILDVEANFLVLLAYNYTTITSVMLLDCFTIPCAMVLSYFFLGCRYTKKHYLGTFVCLIGLVCIILNDFFYGEQSSSKNAVLGDVFCLIGAMLYACSNVIQETLVKFHSRDRFLGSLGGFGTFIALFQCLLFDLKGLQQAHFTPYVILSMAGFVLCLFLMYVNTTAYLQKSDAILFNLSLLTSDVYAVIFTYFFYGYLVGWAYFLAFGLVIAGLVLYHSEKPPLQVGQDQGSSALHPLLTALCLKEKVEVDSYGMGSDGRKSGGGGNFEYNPIHDDSSHGQGHNGQARGHGFVSVCLDD
jgi:solute carrier family 35 protein F1/2